MMKLAKSSGQAACGCSVCGETFASLTQFDLHQTWDYSQRLCRCRPPEALGLVRGSNGTWMTPGTAKKVENLVRNRGLR